MHKPFKTAIAGLAALGVTSFATLPAATIAGGTATWTVDEGFSDALGWLDSNFGGSKTRAQILSGSTAGDAPYNRVSGQSGTLGTSTTPGGGNTPGRVIVTDSIRPFGEVPLNNAGGTTPGMVGSSRTRLATTLDIDPANILGSWSVSNNAFGFTGNTTLGEQIAFTGMQRWGGPFTGVLLYGDFGLRYNGTQLVLTSNIDFLHAEFATLGNPNITYNNGILSIAGDLLVGEGLFLLDQTSTIGTKFGTFSMTATTSAVPEPSRALLIMSALVAVVWRRRKFF